MRKRLHVISSGGLLICTVFSLLMVSLLATTSEAKQENVTKQYVTKQYGMFNIPVQNLIVLQAETPAETPVETPTATPVPPTNTSVPPTNTPVPPTNTPAETGPITPTATPVPTNTPVPPTSTPESPVEQPNLVLSAPVEVNVGDEIVVQVGITNAVNMDAFGFDVVPSSGDLRFVSADGTGTLTEDFFLLQGTLRADGSVRIGAAGGLSSVNGDGNLLNLRYAGLAAGEVTLSITNLLDDLRGAAVNTITLQVTGETGPDTPTATPVPPTATPVPPTPTPGETGPDTPTATPVPPTATPLPPTPTPGETGPDEPTATPTPFVFENSFQGITMLDGFGGIHEIGDIVGFADLNGDGVLNDPGSSRIPLPFFGGQDVYRDIEVFIENEGTPEARISSVVGLTGRGKVFSTRFVSTPNGIRPDVGYLPGLLRTFNSVDALRAIELVDSGNGYVVVFNDGKIRRVNTDESRVTLQDTIVDLNRSPAVDIEVLASDAESVTGYVLDARGRIHTFGGAPALVGVPVSENPVFVDMELVTISDQVIAVVADGLGNFYIGAEEGTTVPDVPLPVLNFNNANVLIDVEAQIDSSFTQFDGLGVMAITRIGSVHTAGAIDFFLTSDGELRRPDLSTSVNADGQTVVDLGFFGFDILRDLELYVIGQ